MKKALFVLAFCAFLFPSVSSAAGLTYQQASSIIVLLEAFNVDQATINTVWGFIAPEDTPLSAPTTATTQNTNPQYQPEFGSTAPVQTIPQSQSVTPVVVAPSAPAATCDDTPTLTYQAYGYSPVNGPYSTLLTASQINIGVAESLADMVGFYVQASSACGSNWVINDTITNTDNVNGGSMIGNPKDVPSTTNTLNSTVPFRFVTEIWGAYDITFTASDGKTTGSIVVPVIVSGSF